MSHIANAFCAHFINWFGLNRLSCVVSPAGGDVGCITFDSKLKFQTETIWRKKTNKTGELDHINEMKGNGYLGIYFKRVCFGYFCSCH